MKTLLTALVALATLTAATPADARSGPALQGVGEFEHKELGEWMALYWTWWLGGDQADHVKKVRFFGLPPMNDDDGDGVFAGEIDVSLTTKDSFALPMFVWNGETYDNGTPDDDEAFPPEETFTNCDLVFTIDGVDVIDSELDDLAEFYFEPAVYPSPVVYPEPSSYGSVSAIWVKGLGFTHTPLAQGTHVMHMELWSPDFGIGFSNTWNVTVTKH